MTRGFRLVLSHGSAISTEYLSDHCKRVKESMGKQARAFHLLRVEETHVIYATVHPTARVLGRRVHGHLAIIKCLSTVVLT